MIDKLDVKHMRVFLNLMRERNVSRVALRMNISQQAASAYLKRLRELFPHELFLRKSDGLVPTDFAYDLASKLEAVVLDLDELVASTPFDPSASNRVVKILADEYAQLTIIPRLCRNIAAAGPDMSLDIQDINAATHPETLASGAADLAIGFRDLIDHGLIRETVKKDYLSCVVSKHSAIPQRISSLRDLADVPRVGFIRSIDKPNQSGDHAFGQLPFHGKLAAVLPCYTSLHSFMEFNDVFAYVPSAIAAADDLRVLPFTIEPNELEIAVAWHRRAAGSSLRKWLVELVVKSVMDKR
ncbi:LysR family transcriptional regulator [Burkholderia ubonensis]|uniref:LysR family transcriptional regulator n=1 Tax=Burkholderia ubonensis TaxID=101571 RepID=UPI000752110B|nr:LysR family transcriptional regulator [Burkholderia ubonensis]KVO05889.1 hypothetical protein WJ71_11115 [Burkholderia ubonensis]